MYIRWKRKKRTKEIAWMIKEGDYIYAVLVEARRIDGKPRQKTVKYLGGIREKNQDIYGQMTFWDKAEKELASLNLDPAARNKIIVSLEKVVPKPSQDDLIKWQEARNEVRKRWEERILKGRT